MPLVMGGNPAKIGTNTVLISRTRDRPRLRIDREILVEEPVELRVDSQHLLSSLDLRQFTLRIGIPKTVKFFF